MFLYYSFVQSKEEFEAKHQSCYNLRRRKEEVDGRSTVARPTQELHQLQEKDANISAIVAASLAPKLDFGGKIGRLFDAAYSANFGSKEDMTWTLVQM